MNREEYLQQRTELMNRAQAHIDAGELEEAESIMNEVKELDQEYERAAAAVANIRALKNNIPVPAGIQNIMTGTGNIIDQTEDNGHEELNVDSSTYREAFFNRLMGNEVTNEQERVFANVIPNILNTMTGTSTLLVVPTTTSSKIWR